MINVRQKATNNIGVHNFMPVFGMDVLCVWEGTMRSWMCVCNNGMTIGSDIQSIRRDTNVINYGTHNTQTKLCDDILQSRLDNVAFVLHRSFMYYCTLRPDACSCFSPVFYYSDRVYQTSRSLGYIRFCHIYRPTGIWANLLNSWQNCWYSFLFARESLCNQPQCAANEEADDGFLYYLDW